MYCKLCGRENKDENIYCSNDGVKLEDKPVDISLKSSMKTFCPECGHKSREEDTYCMNCGNDLYQVEKKSANSKMGLDAINMDLGKLNVEMPKFSGLDLSSVFGENKETIKKDYGFGIIGFIAVILIGLVLNSQINNSFNEIVSKEMGLGLDLNTKLVGFFDSLAFLNLGHFKLSMAAVGESMSLDMKSGIYVFALIPLVIFAIIGALKARQDLDNEPDLIKLPINALIYGFLMGIMSLFTRKSMKPDIPLFGNMMTIKKKFGFFSIFIKGSILAAMGMVFGYAIFMKIKRIRLKNELEDSILSASLIFGSFLLISTFILYLFMRKDAEGFIEKLTMAQFAVYGFGVANMSSLNLMLDGKMENISVFNNLGEFLEGTDVNTVLVIVLLAIVPLVFFIKGMKDKKEGKDFYLGPIVYSILHIVFMKLMSVSLIAPGEATVSLDINLIKSILGVVLISLLPNFAGYLLAGGDKDEA